MSTIRLSQSLASIKGTMSRVTAENSDLHQKLQKPALVNGKLREYAKLQDTGIDRMPEGEKVQLNASDALATVVRNYKELSDINAARDYGNTVARGTVTIDGVDIIKDAPPTFLMFLSHQLDHLKVIIEKTVTLDQAQEWTLDEKINLWKSRPSQTFSTDKVQAALTLVAPTDKHPGQAQVITKDINIGVWTTTHFSGAIPFTRRMQLLARIDQMQKAVDEALNECNAAKVARQDGISAPLFDYLLK